MTQPQDGKPVQFSFRECCKFIIAGEAARLFLQGVPKDVLGPLQHGIPAAARGVEYLVPILVSGAQAWLKQFGDRRQAALAIESIAQLDSAEAQRIAEEALRTVPSIDPRAGAAFVSTM